MTPRAMALLETAIRTGSTDGERTNAISALRTMFDKAGGVSTFFDRPVSQPSTPPPAYVSYNARREQTIKMETDLRERDERIALLENEVQHLRKENADFKAREAHAATTRRRRVAEDGSMSYIDFSREVQRRLVNADRRWQMVFHEQTGLARNKFPGFQHRGRVDDLAYIDALATLKTVDVAERCEAVWTKREVDQVRYLTDVKKMSERDMALRLSQDFNRRITENMLKRLKLNSRDGVGQFRDPSFGGPIGRKRAEINADKV